MGMLVAASAASSMRSSTARPACDACARQCSRSASRCAHVRTCCQVHALRHAIRTPSQMLLPLQPLSLQGYPAYIRLFKSRLPRAVV